MNEFKRVAVVGTGTMGPGMGSVMARAGAQVTLYDLDESALERAREGTKLAVSILERLGVPDQGGAVDFQTDLESAVAGADLVVEAVPEQLALKQQVFAQFEDLVPVDRLQELAIVGRNIVAADLFHGPKGSGQAAVIG